MSKKSRTEKERELIQEVIKHLELHKKEYGYVATDDHGLYAYNISPKNCKIAYDEVYSISDPNMKYHFISRDEIITSIFKFPEVYKIEEAIIILKRRIIDMDLEQTATVYNYEKSPVNRLFKLLSEVQGVEIKPYDKFDIKDTDSYNLICGPYYLDEHFKRWSSSSNPKYNNGEECNNERVLRGILTGEMKILKCKKAVVLTEDDIICLKYYLKNGYRYIANETTEDLEGKQQRLKLFKEKPIYNKRNVTYRYVWEHYINENNIIKDTDWTIVKDKLSFEHYDYPEIWDIEELLEQERVNND